MRHGRICKPAGNFAVFSVFGFVGQQAAPGTDPGRIWQGDWVLCQITSNPFSDSAAIEISDHDFSAGGLQRVSYARPGKLFTAHESLFQRAVGHLAQERHAEIVEVVVRMLRADSSF